MTTTHITGFPRIGAKRELKFILEQFWQGKVSAEDVFAVGQQIRAHNRQLQQKAGIDLLPVGDFSYYDQVLDGLILVGAIPKRFGFDINHLTLQQYSELARGNTQQPALEMTKWFDTNYHYLVPEWHADTEFHPITQPLIAQVEEIRKTGVRFKPTLIGPVSLLHLGKSKEENFSPLALLPKLITTYQQIIEELSQAGAEYIHLDEPILALFLQNDWLEAFKESYQTLSLAKTKLIIGTYFASVVEQQVLLKHLPIAGLHLDLIRAPEQLSYFLKDWPQDKILSLGIIDGRNIWKTDLNKVYQNLSDAKQKLTDRLWLSTSCSLLHTAQDLALEEKLDHNLKQHLAFAVQKLDELTLLKKALDEGQESVQAEFTECARIMQMRQHDPRVHNAAVQERLAKLSADCDQRKNPFSVREKLQHKRLKLPLLPTTTVGSFPQTSSIRQARAQYKKGELSRQDYEKQMQEEIRQIVNIQEELDIDVLVHGEPERNDMVEYFGEQLKGYLFTEFGWVQSYGTRCVKPPIIYGDVSRSQAMTVSWSTFAQSLTQKPMKGMLTGPVTILQWSFVRDDIPRSRVAEQIALALNDEVRDLEKAGIQIIQIDEPAYREGLPLQRKDWDNYLSWASRAFRLTFSGVQDETQIHTHMCYSDFQDILPAIVAMDADVITMETSRSDMELLDIFMEFNYPNEIGPGVYDIHSPRVPTIEELRHLIKKALQVIPATHLWINPDCGLKTRSWEEVKSALANMVKVAKQFREELNQQS